MSGYSVDLRRRIVSAVESGMSKAQAARTFSASLSSVKRCVNKAEKGESLAPKKRPGSAPKLDEKARRLLEDDLRERPYLTLQDRCEYIEVMTGLSVSHPTMCRAIARIGATRKRGASRHRARGVRRGSLAGDGGRGGGTPERLIFVDECGTHTSLGPIYGYAPRGERLLLSVPPRKRGKNTTLLSSMTLSGMGPSLVAEGATTARVFEAYVEKVLVPSLRAGQIVVVDNLGAHRPKRIRELIEQQGCELVYLPAYSPDYNPIEEAFAKIKNLLRKAAARSKEVLVEAIGAALSAVTAADARGSFEHAGYRPTAHLQ